MVVVEFQDASGKIVRMLKDLRFVLEASKMIIYVSQLICCSNKYYLELEDLHLQSPNF